MPRIKYREIDDPIDEIIGRFLGGVGRHPTEDDLNDAIDKKYAIVHINVMYLKRQKCGKKEIMRLLHIGEVSYAKAMRQLKDAGTWKEYEKR